MLKISGFPIIICSFLILFFNKTSLGQAARTPFSAFGIGEYYGPSLAHNQGMAGVGISNPQNWYLNNQNPALLVFNQLTTFNAGLVGERRTIRGADGRERNNEGNLNYLSLGFPIKVRKWSTSIVLQPYTNVNYQLTYQQPIENSTATVDVTEEGTGGLNQVSWAHGVAINKNISVGLKANYLFSSISRTFQNQLSNTTERVLVVPGIVTRQNFSDVTFTAGVSLRKDSVFNKKYRLNLGLVYDFRSNLSARYYEAVQLGTSITALDTLVNNERRSVVLPQTIGFGLSFGRPDFWTVGTDFTLLDYTDFRDINGSNPGATRGYQWAVGAELTPDPTSLSNYLKRMTFRAGVSLNRSPYLVNGNTLQDFGINFGFSMPVSRVSSLDLGARWGRRGDVNDNTVQENYFRIYFGVTFNDQWFIKRRFD